MRTWQVERRKRTRHLIELGGLVVKAGIVDLTGDDRAIIFGALLWMADKLKSDQGEQARALWAAKGKQAFEMDPATPYAQIVDARQWHVSLQRDEKASSGHLEEIGSSACNEAPEKVCLLPANWAGRPPPRQGARAECCMRRGGHWKRGTVD